MAQVKVFLFTDLESSTRRWEADAPGMSAALDRHDEIVRRVLDQHGGHWFKHTGDGACAVFDSAMSAVEAAAAIQNALRDDTMLTARIGVHLGEAEARGDDWFGPTLNRCARLMSAAHGGQSVLSGEVASSVRGRVALRDLGEHLLRDLGQPIHVFQLGEGDFPPLRSLSTTPTNLPAQRSSFIGRDKELARLDAQLHEARLVTLVGVGGTGKTRLAIQAAAAASERFPDGTFLVELALVRDPLLVGRAIAEVVGAIDPLVGAEARDAGEATEAVLDRLASWGSSRRVLLVLDNCEHLIEAAAGVADRLLSAGRDIAILATSREPLMIDGEHIVPVPPLDRASELFADRARAVRPDFEMTSENLDLVESLCARLDRIPLAIELAAARLRALSVEQISERLDDTFRLLTGGARTSTERHHTLAGTLRWSYDLLSPQERVLFRRLAVFVGGATLEAIETVCQDEASSGDVLDLVQQLVDKSLLVFDEGSRGSRYRMLEIVHQYAAGLLAASDEASSVRDRHVTWAVQLSAPIVKTLMVDWAYCDVIEPEQQNLAQAFTWAVGSDNGEAALSLAVSTAMYWRGLGLVTRARDWLLIALERSDGTDPFQRATAGALAANMSQLVGGYATALWDFDRSASEFASIGFPLGVAYSIFGKARALDIVGRGAEAEPLHDQAAEIFLREGDAWGAATQAFNRAWVLFLRHDYDAALALVGPLAAADAQEIGLESRSISTAMVGFHTLLHGDVEGGRKIYRDALARIAHVVVEHGYGCYFAAAVELSAGDADLGEQLLRESLDEVRMAGSIEQLGGQLSWAAVIAHRRGNDRRAAELFAAADRHSQVTSITIPPAGDPTIVQSARERVWAALEPAARAEAEVRARSWTLSDAADAALSVLSAAS